MQAPLSEGPQLQGLPLFGRAVLRAAQATVQQCRAGEAWEQHCTALVVPKCGRTRRRAKSGGDLVAGLLVSMCRARVLYKKKQAPDLTPLSKRVFFLMRVQSLYPWPVSVSATTTVDIATL
jgi:hypothetical protein